ncbi:hypothetical protein NAT47_10040 [Flavobacterium sp. HXWNR69]|uniref:Secreted protein n=1 Tax=Flavobacterium fragile TaxID=2949085 RepID=A0ABT0TIG5_9FLAO|nr:hypothetical protein [Flavobacterium sp. HXWNR69]MCL9770759.1 hypothetical protein [Flavobacterium sp. HXWNR69]
MKKSVLLLLLIGFSFSFAFAQENYKYIIVPSQFSFLDEANKYDLNELTKKFFQSEGFEVFYDNEKFPDDLLRNRCLALYALPVETNTMFLTKIYFEIKDCTNSVLLKSELASSREKNYKNAYTITFRQTLSSLKNKLNFKTENNLEAVVPPKEVVVVSNINDNLNSGVKIESSNDQLFAIPINNGFKLVNDTPETMFILMKTSVSNTYFAQKSDKSGVLIKKNENWYFEYYEGEKLFSEKVEVKF